ncbi:MAG TPA: RNB domain-containing ribonuclease [Luteitalea sp.]|nr:RNB domain-containing ribonuclease [Luteitalea sp.]
MASHTDLAELAREAMRARGLEPEFPPEALAQLARLAPEVDGAGVVDQRALPWCSIDNDDSRDLDQLTVAERLDDGRTRVLVAIADVDALVARGTPIDDHARHNTTSVYTPTRVFPMLPERLSTDLTSLNEAEDRLAVVVAFVVGDDGRPGDGTVSRALVRNQARLTYDDVAAWLEGTGEAPRALTAAEGLDERLRLQDDAAGRLRERRRQDGALDLEGTDARVVVSDGKVVGLQPDTKNRARALIEDFMIAVNGVTARCLEESGLPSIRRVVRSPRRWDRLQALAVEAGESLPDAPDPRALGAFLAGRRKADPAGYRDLSLAVLKLLGRGEYVLTRATDEGVGHFGLAVDEYVHSTAPNRRFPDLITQRLLKASVTGSASPYPDEELDALARHCTMQEDAADKVERQMRKSAAALLLSTHVGERFDAMVTGASDKGVWVRTFAPIAEGRVVRGASGLDVGERVAVTLVATDVAKGFIDFARA